MKLKMQKWQQTAVWMASLVAFGIGEACAQTAARSQAPARDIVGSAISTVIFGMLGIILAIIGFKLFDIVVKFDLEREICEKQNLAVALLCGFMVLGICLIIAATVLS
jgi:uncharacterized membrane protein YjfL (UPF0719 family)